MIGQTVSHYCILKKIGEGGMGVVYEAEDLLLGRHVAIKFLAATADEQPQFRARFLREARSASKLDHPHIATVHDYGEALGRPFIVMELIRGETLYDLLKSGALPTVRAMKLIEAVAEALAEAHRHGIVHRDIKPSNIAITERGTVKVLDFGLAKQMIGVGASAPDVNALTLPGAQTQSNAIIGTPLYLSPEQAMAAPLDHRSDLFSLGSVLYECLTGAPAFIGASLIEICTRVINAEPPPPSHVNESVPPELDSITLKALAKEPAARYQSAEEMLAELGSLRSALQAVHLSPTISMSSEVGRSPAGGFRRVPHQIRRRLFFYVPAALAVIIIALLGWWAASSRFRSPVPIQPNNEVAGEYFLRGKSFLRDGAYYQAVQALDRSVKEDGNFAPAHARLAEAWLELEDTEQAQAEMLKARSLAPDTSKLAPADGLHLQAVNNVLIQDFAGAVERYRELAQMSPATEVPSVLLSIGRAYEKNGKIKEELASYTEAVKRNSQYAAVYLRLGALHARAQEYKQAATAFDQAEDLYKAQGNMEGRTEVFYLRGVLLLKRGQIAAARAQLQQALDLARGNGNESQQISTLLQLSDVAFENGDMAEAGRLANEAINFARRRGLENLATRGLIRLGDQASSHEDYREAENNYQQALDSARRNNARYNEAWSLFSLGSVNLQQFKADEGLSYLQRALSFYESNGYREDGAKTRLLIARAQRMNGDYGPALAEVQRQLQDAEQRADGLKAADLHVETGQVLMAQERYPEALTHFDQSYTIGQTLDDKSNNIFSLLSRSDALRQLGRYEDVRASLAQASALISQDSTLESFTSEVSQISAEIALSERRFSEAKAKSRLALTQAGTPETTLRAKLALGLAQVFSGEREQGLELCTASVDAATRFNDARLLSNALLALAEAKLESGDRRGALDDARRAQEMFARSGQQESGWRALSIAARASTATGDNATARTYASRADELLASLRQQWGDDAFNLYAARPDIREARRQFDALRMS